MNENTLDDSTSLNFALQPSPWALLHFYTHNPAREGQSPRSVKCTRFFFLDLQPCAGNHWFFRWFFCWYGCCCCYGRKRFECACSYKRKMEPNDKWKFLLVILLWLLLCGVVVVAIVCPFYCNSKTSSTNTTTLSTPVPTTPATTPGT